MAVRRRTLLAAVTCNVLEFFDFVAYAFFAVQIGRAFFPTSNPGLSLMLSVAVFGVGFFARPVGSLVIGHYADRVGRRPALLLTAALMTCGTLGLAVVPTYASIGLAAPLIVTACRLLQGFALGGEIGPSTAFLLEIAGTGRRATFVSLQLVSQGAAAVLAGSIALAMSAVLDPAAMADWGWRVPFAIGALLVPVALYLRSNMPETLGVALAEPMVPEQDLAPGRVKTVMLCIALILAGTVSTYVGNYMATYASTVLKLPPTAGLLVTFAVGLATIVGAIVGGWIADQHGRWSMMFWPRVGSAVLTVPGFMLLGQQRDTGTLLAVSAILAFLTAMNGSGVLTAICELFPPRRRATSLALVYSIGVSLFGGTTQFVVTWLTQATGNPLAPAWYVVGASIVAILAATRLPETRPRSPGASP